MEISRYRRRARLLERLLRPCVALTNALARRVGRQQEERMDEATELLLRDQILLVVVWPAIRSSRVMTMVGCTQPYLCDVSAASRPHLGCISAISRLYLGTSTACPARPSNSARSGTSSSASSGVPRGRRARSSPSVDTCTEVLAGRFARGCAARHRGARRGII